VLQKWDKPGVKPEASLRPWLPAGGKQQNESEEKRMSATAPLLVGSLDAYRDGIVHGWAWDRARPDQPVDICIYNGDVLLDTVRARAFRADLREAGIGDGRHAFTYACAGSLPNGRYLSARFAQTGSELEGSPLFLQSPAQGSSVARPNQGILGRLLGVGARPPEERSPEGPRRSDPYAAPRRITDLANCAFYHTMEIPGYGLVEGEWDLRESVGDYLGNVEVHGKRVLDLGKASGFLTFHMEAQGAEVVAYDLSGEEPWDVVPYAGDDPNTRLAQTRTHVWRVNNGFWLAHRAFQSQARVVYGTVYAIPEEIGPVDISVVTAVLLHLRDPFLALQNALRLTRETVIIAEAVRDPRLHDVGEPYLRFLPNPVSCEPKGGWWEFSPEAVRRFVAVLGFEDTAVTHHTQTYQGERVPVYTVVGRRTKGGTGLVPAHA
jgi:hypothetical protein